MANTGHLKIYVLFKYVSSNNWVNRWINKWHVFQIIGQKQRFNEISSHILVYILVLCHAYGTFTNIRNLHHASYNFRLCKSWLLTNVVHGSSTVTLPWVRFLNTDQLITEPWGMLQFVYWAAMSPSDRTLSQMLTLANRPWKVWCGSKPPPIKSCSCPSTRKPSALST